MHRKGFLFADGQRKKYWEVNVPEESFCLTLQSIMQVIFGRQIDIPMSAKQESRSN